MLLLVPSDRHTEDLPAEDHRVLRGGTSALRVPSEVHHALDRMADDLPDESYPDASCDQTEDLAEEMADDLPSGSSCDCCGNCSCPRGIPALAGTGDAYHLGMDPVHRSLALRDHRDVVASLAEGSVAADRWKILRNRRNVCNC